MDEKNLKKVTVDSRKNQKLSSPQVKLRTLMLEPHGGLTQTPQPKSPRLCQALWVGSGGTWEKPRLKTGELGGEAQATVRKSHQPKQPGSLLGPLQYFTFKEKTICRWLGVCRR